MRCFTILIACGWLLVYEGKSDFISYFQGPAWHIVDSFDNLAACKSFRKKMENDAKTAGGGFNYSEFNVVNGLCLPPEFLKEKRIKGRLRDIRLGKEAPSALPSIDAPKTAEELIEKRRRERQQRQQ